MLKITQPNKNKSLLLYAALFVTLLTVTARGVAAGVIYEMEFQSDINGLSVTTTQTLTVDDSGVYELRTHTSNFFASLTELSRFDQQDGQIRPLEHQFNRNIFGSKRKELTTFNWDEGEAIWTGKEKTRSDQIQPGVFDRALYQLQISQDLENGQDKLSYQLFDRGRSKSYAFHVVGEDTLKTGVGDIEAIKVARVKNEPDDADTEIWFAPSLDYQIVKLSHTDDDGTSYSMILNNIVTARNSTNSQ